MRRTPDPTVDDISGLAFVGSSAIRSPSPTKLIESVVTRIASPGKRLTHQARLSVSRPSESMMPHSGVGGLAPRPRKLSPAAVRMAEATPHVA